MARPAEGNPSTEHAWPPLIARMADAGEENKEGYGSDMRGLEGDQPLEGNEPKKNTASPRNTGQATPQPEITAVYKPGPNRSQVARIPGLAFAIALAAALRQLEVDPVVKTTDGEE